ncbi:hypothetical protein V6N13_079054 [Hibiscus sabdariffa]
MRRSWLKLRNEVVIHEICWISRSRISRSVSFDSISGSMTPLELFDDKQSGVRDGRVNIVIGSGPLKLQEEHFKDINLVRFPRTYGNRPRSPFPDKYMELSRVRFPNDDGIDPLKPQRERSNNSRPLHQLLRDPLKGVKAKEAVVYTCKERTSKATVTKTDAGCMTGQLVAFDSLRWDSAT